MTFYKITKIVLERAFCLVKNLWFIVPVDSQKTLKLFYKSNRAHFRKCDLLLKYSEIVNQSDCLKRQRMTECVYILMAEITLETDYPSEKAYPLDNSRRTDNTGLSLKMERSGWTIRLTLSICFSVDFEGFRRCVIRLRRIIRLIVKTAKVHYSGRYN